MYTTLPVTSEQERIEVSLKSALNFKFFLESAFPQCIYAWREWQNNASRTKAPSLEDRPEDALRRPDLSTKEPTKALNE